MGHDAIDQKDAVVTVGLWLPGILDDVAVDEDEESKIQPRSIKPSTSISQKLYKEAHTNLEKNEIKDVEKNEIKDVLVQSIKLPHQFLQEKEGLGTEQYLHQLTEQTCSKTVTLVAFLCFLESVTFKSHVLILELGKIIPLR